MTTYDLIHGISQILGAVAWPILVGAVILGFRKPLTELIRHVHKLTVGSASLDIAIAEAKGEPDAPAKIESEAALDDEVKVETTAEVTAKAHPPSVVTSRSRPFLRKYYAANARENPKSAIILAFIQDEHWFDRALTSHGHSIYDGFTKRGVREMSAVAISEGILPQSFASRIDGLAGARDLIVDAPGESVSPEQALEYLEVTDDILDSLDLSLAVYEMGHPPTHSTGGLDY